MPLPNAKMKISRSGKSELRFENKINQAEYLITELSRAALRDTAKFVRKLTIQETKTLRGMKRLKRPYNLQYWVRKRETDLLIGFKHDAWYSTGAERGKFKMRERNFLRNTVYENVGKIRQIQSQYLTALNAENPSDPGDDEYKSPAGEE